MDNYLSIPKKRLIFNYEDIYDLSKLFPDHKVTTSSDSIFDYNEYLQNIKGNPSFVDLLKISTEALNKANIDPTQLDFSAGLANYCARELCSPINLSHKHSSGSSTMQEGYNKNYDSEIRGYMREFEKLASQSDLSTGIIDEISKNLKNYTAKILRKFNEIKQSYINEDEALYAAFAITIQDTWPSRSYDGRPTTWDNYNNYTQTKTDISAILLSLLLRKGYTLASKQFIEKIPHTMQKLKSINNIIISPRRNNINNSKMHRWQKYHCT